MAKKIEKTSVLEQLFEQGASGKAARVICDLFVSAVNRDLRRESIAGVDGEGLPQTGEIFFTAKQLESIGAKDPEGRSYTVRVTEENTSGEWWVDPNLLPERERSPKRGR